MAIGLLQKRNKEVNKVVMIPVDKIASNRHQPRKHFDQNALQELCYSILANGLLQPVTVRRTPEQDGYELIAGERRTIAYRILGKEYIPAIIWQYTDDESATLSLIENLQRKDLNFFEEAAGIARLMEQMNLTQQQVSQKLGKAQSTIANKLRLLKYSLPVQEMMLENMLTERHARAMLKLSEEKQQREAIAYIAGHALNVEQTERYVQALLEAATENKRSSRMVVKDMRLFINSLNRAVNMMKSAGIKVDTQKREDEDFLEYTIKVPKTAVYRDS